MTLLVNEDFFAVHLVVLMKNTAKGTFLQGVERSVGPLEMNYAVQGAPLNLLKRETGQRFGGRVHEDALVAIIHDEQGHGGIGGDGLGEAKLLTQRSLHAFALSNVLDDGNQLRRPALLPVHGG